MVEIIIRGTPPSEKSYQVECKNCKSTLKVQHKELTYQHDPRPGEGGYYFECPVCNKNVWIYGI